MSTLAGGLQKRLLPGYSAGRQITFMRPPPGDPEAKLNECWLLQWTLYGLCCSPCNWYNKISKVLQALGLQPSLKIPCLFTGFIWDLNNSTGKPNTKPLSLGLYINNFVYFVKDPAVEGLFCHLLHDHCRVDLMGVVEWFLGVHFLWRITPSSVLVHLNQSGFAANLVESFFRESRDPTPTATPYRSGISINSIAPSTEADNCPALLC
jgi:hypothetical protein